MPPVEPNDEERQEQLPEDGQTPFQPADSTPDPVASTPDPLVGPTDSSVPVDHPATDTNVDPQQSYDEGTAAAAGVSDQSAQDAVADFTPPAPAAEDAPAATDDSAASDDSVTPPPAV